MSVPWEVTAYELRQWFNRKLHIAGHNDEAASSAVMSPTSYFISTFFFVLREQLSVSLLDLRTWNTRRKAVNEVVKSDPGFHARRAGVYHSSVTLDSLSIPRAQVNAITEQAGDLSTPAAYGLVWSALLAPLPSSDERRVAVAWPLCADKRRAAGGAGAARPLSPTETACMTQVLSVTASRYATALEKCTSQFDVYTKCVTADPLRAAGCFKEGNEVVTCFASAGISTKVAV